VDPSGVIPTPPFEPCAQGAVPKTALLAELISVIPPETPGTQIRVSESSSVEEVFEGGVPDPLLGTANATISARKPVADITAVNNLSFMPPPHDP
jgi:hypothetical protein